MIIVTDEARRRWHRSGAERWGLALPDFAAALERSAAQRFRGESPTAPGIEAYLDSLKLDDLALACACARGSEPAWEHFVREFRPILLRIASRGQTVDRARDVADSIYGELYGLDERDGVRRSLFDYYHGRSTLAGWLKAVVAQRLVDRARSERRLEPLPDDETALQQSGRDEGPDVDRQRYLAIVQGALAEALSILAARDRLRLSLYYAQDLTLAKIGTLLGESEATASRKLERTRRDVRAAVERRLRDEQRLTDAEIALCFDYARTDPAFDLARTLPPPEG
ncbi:MAG: sigma-70 family RNA polymerase sigma factor [Acidobacteria bacterium]|nr:sigma-70 family RNA polymerase sigma factor [Acidobacteriota bacterium]